MKMPKRLEPLVSEGIIQEVIRPLKSGKEAQIFLVVAGGEERVAKVYKEQAHRSFSQRADYTEGRKVRNSRDKRAMEKRTNYGRAQEEEQWLEVEAKTIYILKDAGVRVPAPYIFMDGVLVMEYVRDDFGNPAPRLAETHLGVEEKKRVFRDLLTQTARMLSVNIVHGDLSIYNVLYDGKNPIIIDFPQAIDSTANSNAKRIFIRDVQSLASHFLRDSNQARKFKFGEEIWKMYQRGELSHDMDFDDLMNRAYGPEEEESIVDEPVLPLGRRAVVMTPSAPARNSQRPRHDAPKSGTPRKDNRNKPRRGPGNRKK